MAAKTTQKAQDGTTIPAAQEKAEKTAENGIQKPQSLPEALNYIQTRLKAPKDKFNSFSQYHYRSAEGILEAVKPLLAFTGCTLNLSDEIVLIGSRFYVKATATLSFIQNGEPWNTPSGPWTQTAVAYAREDESKKGMDGSQVTGTASSYARKYALNGLLCIDDAKDADTDEYHAQTTGEQPKAKAQAAPLSGIDKEAYYREISELPNAEAVQAWWKCHKPEFPAGVDTEMYTACKRQLEHLNQIKNNQ